jgi:hypothetical protein
MNRRLLHLCSLFLLMLVTGVFWGTWFTLTRSIEDFSLEEFIHIGKVIIANVALPMRIIMPLSIVMLFLSLWVEFRDKPPGYYFGVTSFILLIAVLLMTLLVLVPIDNQIKEWTAATAPADFENIRAVWKNYHAGRTFVSLTSFVCFSWFLIFKNKMSMSDE